MKYENAKEILPEALLKEVQRYAGGKLLYIPVENESKSWGEVSGYRQKLLKRNVMICNRYKKGETLSELAEEYFLSLDSIKKIVYGKKEKNLLFEPTVESSVQYANAGLLEEWLTLYQNAFLENVEMCFDEVIHYGTFMEYYLDQASYSVFGSSNITYVLKINDFYTVKITKFTKCC